MISDDSNKVKIIPVIEIGASSALPQRNTLEEKLVTNIRASAHDAKYTKTPDGWFVPLHDLMSRLEEVAEHVHNETMRYAEFEIFGGFQFLTADGRLVDVPFSSNFRSTMTLTETISNLHPNSGVHNVLVSAQDIWQISLEDDQIDIRIDQAMGQETKHYQFPHSELRQSLRQAWLEVERFVMGLEPLLQKYHNQYIEPHAIKWMFGLDRFTSAINRL
jgi:hypothetical protein